MNPAPDTSDERARLSVLHDLLRDPAFGTAGADPALAALARRLAADAGWPGAALSVVGSHTVQYLAASGVARACLPPVPRATSFCGHAVLGHGPLAVVDAARDPRFEQAPLVCGEPALVAYAGMPVVVQGHRIGAVCVFDTRAHEADAGVLAALDDMATLAAALFDGRLRASRLQRLESRITAASQAGSDWLWETDADGLLTWVSDSVMLHTGQTPEQEVGHHGMQIHRPPPGELLEAWDRYRDQRERHEPFLDAIAERDTATGTMLVAFSGRPYFDVGGRFAGYRGAARDVTQAVADRTHNERRQRLLERAFERVRAGMMIRDADGRVLMSNDTWRRAFGLHGHDGAETWPEMLRRLVYRGTYPDAVGREDEFIGWRLALPTPEGHTQEVRFADRYVLVTEQMLPDGSVIHLSFDVTERRLDAIDLERQRAELAASEARMEAVLGAVPDLWFVFDAEGRYLQCSNWQHPWLVRPFEELRGRHFSERLPSPLAERGPVVIRAAQASGTLQRFEYEVQTLDGVHRSFEARVSPMPGGQVLYITRDLTELRQLERDMLVMKRALDAEAAMPLVVADARQPDMPLIYVNPAFERLTGYDRAQVLGRNCRFLQGPRTQQASLDTLRAALAAGSACTVILNNQRRDGSDFVCELHVAPVHDAEGRLTHYIGMQNDVTERNRAMEQLRHSEELYRSVASAITDGLMIIGPDGRIVAANPSAEAMLGAELATLLGSRLSLLGYTLLWEDGSEVPASQHPVRVAATEGRRLVGQVHGLRWPDGRVRLFALNVLPLSRPEAGRMSCLVTFRDITAERAAARALSEAEERWKFALEGAGDGVWDLDEDSATVFYSPRWKQMIGFEENDIGNTIDEWSRRIHGNDAERVLKAFESYRHGETDAFEVEYRLRHKQGHWLWMLDRGKIVERRPDGSARRIVGTNTDVTRQKLAERALRDQKAAELASRSKTEFLSRMSHEMRTPLNAVLGFAQLLQLQGGARTDYVDHIADAGRHLLALINDVLDLQQVEAGRMKMDIVALPLDPVLAACATLLEPLAATHGVRLLPPPANGLQVLADERRLRQVLLNVVSNGIKYNGANGQVSWQATALPSGQVELLIEDTGPGMTSDQQARLFQPFERLGRESSNIEGTGLGLLIARRMVREMRGRLDVRSRPGVGTRVRVTLPQVPAAVGAAAAADVAASAPAAAPQAKRLRLLYVEDNRINAMLLEEALRAHRHVEVRVVEDGPQALALALAWPPDVLVLDAQLPGPSGFEVLPQLRALPGLAQVPAAMCSADAMPQDIARARIAGFDAYWTKPLDLSRVMTDVEYLLAGAPAAKLAADSSL
jgi:PAS domain S-box-containing protein